MDVVGLIADACDAHSTQKKAAIPLLIIQTAYNVAVSDSDRLLTIEELAERIQLSVEWIREKVQAGIIPAIRFNSRTWRFHWPTVLAALQRMQ